MQRAADARGIALVAVGFSPPDLLAPVSEHLGWRGLFLSDEQRLLYRKLGLGRAPWWRVYTPGTLAIYARALVGSRPRPAEPGAPGPAEDTRQLGGDAVLRDGVVHTLWSPRSPDDRVDADTLAEAAHRLTPDATA